MRGLGHHTSRYASRWRSWSISAFAVSYSGSGQSKNRCARSLCLARTWMESLVTSRIHALHRSVSICCMNGHCQDVRKSIQRRNKIRLPTLHTGDEAEEQSELRFGAKWQPREKTERQVVAPCSSIMSRSRHRRKAGELQDPGACCLRLKLCDTAVG